MKMIADGKIKDGEIIYRKGNKDYEYTYKYGNLYWKIDNDNITEMFSLKRILEFNFEILKEDTTEEIEEIEELDTKNLFEYMEILDLYEDKINELVRAVNKLNNTTYKAENCMTD